MNRCLMKTVEFQLKMSLFLFHRFSAQIQLTDLSASSELSNLIVSLFSSRINSIMNPRTNIQCVEFPIESCFVNSVRKEDE